MLYKLLCTKGKNQNSFYAEMGELTIITIVIALTKVDNKMRYIYSI